MLRSLYDEILKSLCDGGVSNAKLEARLIIRHRLGFDYSNILINSTSDVSDNKRDEIRGDVLRRLSGEPLSRIYGSNEFWGIEFSLSPDTLDPRQDTETIVDLALQRFGEDLDIRILDLGTGSGCILISLLAEFQNAQGVGVDVSEGALETASQNANALGFVDRCQFILGSWLDCVDGQFDLIVSNPPYIRSDVIPKLSHEVRAHDPILALDGGDDGLQAYKKIFSQLKTFLKPNGIALFEIGYDQDIDVMRLAEKHEFAQRCVHMDISGNPRVVEISCGDK